MYQLRSVSRTYGNGSAPVHAVREVDLHIADGELVAIVGPSGSGKTTLLQLLGALDRASSGDVLFEGRELGSLSDADLTRLRLETMGFVFQQFNLIPTLTASQNVEAALAPSGLDGHQRRERMDAALVAVGPVLDSWFSHRH